MDYTINSITEDIGRQVIKILYDGLNTKIASLSATWSASDATYFPSIGQANPGHTVETISADNFYPGVVPSLIKAPVEKYPNCSAFAYAAVPQLSRDDTADFYTINLRVELMVKSHNSELEVDSRIKRTLQAAQQVLMENRTLNNSVLKLGIPRETTGDVFVRKEANGRGDRWFWQGGVLEFAVEKFVNIEG